MTDSSMNFGPAWIRNMRSEGTTGSGTSSTARYQLAEHRYGREEMLALYDKSAKPPPSLIAFKTLYSEPTLTPLALLPTTEEERTWQSRPTSVSGPSRGRGGSLERGGRVNRGRGGYQTYGRTSSAFDSSGWGNGEQSDWSPRKDFSTRNTVMDNWRKTRTNSEEDDGWRNISTNRPLHEKWGRSTSWRGEGDTEERNGPPERGGRWQDLSRSAPRKSWENEDHLPEWANENPAEGGGTFDERGAFHGSDDEQQNDKNIKKELHKSTSQQHISSKNYNISSSKSTTSLFKTDLEDKQNMNEKDSKELSKLKDNISSDKEQENSSNIPEKNNKNDKDNSDKKISEQHESSKSIIDKKQNNENIQLMDSTSNSSNIDKVEEEFARLQEDLVLKLVVDEETPNPQHHHQQQQQQNSTTSNLDQTTTITTTNNVQPPPNLVPTPASQDKWYYQDPQGTRQGPFLNVEMAEWYKAGYFSNQLNIMRECDERYFLLGELINMCGGENPFLSSIRFPILKNDTPTTTKLADDMLPYQLLSQLAFKQHISMRNLVEPWSALTLQQQELAAQRLLLQQQLPHDLQYLQTSPANNFMFNQMLNQIQQQQQQQSNKMPCSVMMDKSNNSVPNPLLSQIGGLHSLQNRIQTPGLHNSLSAGLSSSLPTDSIGPGISGLQTPGSLPTAGLSLPTLHGGLSSNLNVNRPPTHNPIEQPIPSNTENDPIANFLKQFHQQKQQQQQQPRPQMPLDGSLWSKPNQFSVPQNTPTPWVAPPEPNAAPISMWDMQTTPLSNPPLTSDLQTLAALEKLNLQQQTNQEKEKELIKDDTSQKELKKKREHEEKLAKKEMEEKRKNEQRKQELEKKNLEDKRKKEEEKIKRELEKARKEAEEKRTRELEEKRRLKEQRKAEEEARKKMEEHRKQEEERLKKEAKEREEKNKTESVKQTTIQTIKTAKTAPWSQSNSTQGVSLTDIQKAEKERRAQEAALLLKQQQQLQEMQQMQQAEKTGGLQLSWAKKPLEPRKVKSFAEIQAEEQEKLAKLTAEARLAAQQKEKDAPPVASNTGSIWNGQSLTWANASQQWSSNNATSGFWDDVLVKSTTKPSTVSKNNVSSTMTTTVTTTTTTKQQPQKQAKPKNKKEDSQKPVNNNNNNNNNSSNDEFTSWCYKTLSSLSSDVDIPTFVSFLRDIESAYDVRDYCKEYLGESAATQQFATNFLEKRRSFKPKNNAHKDDMCSPAPAITPSTQHNTEFQEVKGKNKKNKKSKMLKVDSRILGFQVTSAPDRINVGDRDYGDNS